MKTARLWMLALIVAGGAAQAQVVQDDFTTGDGAAPAKWVLAEGKGAWEPAGAGGRCLTVTGTGEDQSYWRRPVEGLRPNTTYRIHYRARTLPGSSPSTVISGLNVCNRDFAAGTSWQPYTFVFTTPNPLPETFIRLGQWHLSGTLQFAGVTLRPVQAVHRAFAGGVTLGAGEAISDKEYTFSAPLGGDGSNSSRCLVSQSAAFNSNRWVMTGGSEILYRHEVAGARQTAAKVTVNVNYHVGGECILSASTDGRQWHELGRIGAAAGRTFDIPTALLPAEAVWVKLAGAGAKDAAGNTSPGAFQIDGYSYSATLDRALPAMQGATGYVEATHEDPALQVRVADLGSMGRGSDDTLRAVLSPAAGLAGDAEATLTLAGEKGPAATFRTRVRLAPGKDAVAAIPYRWQQPGTVRATLQVRSGGKLLYEGQTEDYLPAYFDASYGHALAPLAGGDLWWCEATYKVPPTRTAPAGKAASAITVSAARREREHAQLIFRPAKDPGPVQVSVSDLAGAGGARIPASAIEVREVAYLKVTRPTDRTGVAAEWPDPLPPLEGAWRPKAGRNNLLWLTVSVPADAKPGDYTARVSLQAGAWKRDVPLKLHVWGFTLPEMTALRSGFGVSPGMIRRYHNLKSDAALAQVWDKYMLAFAKRRIAPYNPMALAPFQAKLLGVSWRGGIRDTAEKASGAASLKVVDDSPTSCVGAGTAELIPVKPGEKYVLRWKCKTAQASQEYEVTAGQYDASRNWLTGNNIDLIRKGDGTWQAGEQEITGRLNPRTRFVDVTLRPVVWTEKGERTGTAWFDDVQLVGPDGTSLVADGGFEADGTPHVDLDFTAFDKAAHHYLDEVGFDAFTVSVPGLGGGRYPNYDHGSIFGYAAGTPQYDALMAEYGRKLEEHLAQKGWLQKAYVYWYDEPETSDYPFVVEGMKKLEKYFPRLKRMLTEEFQPPLFGHVQLWCPITPNYSEEPAHARQKLGDEVWWYVCTGPKEPYCTLFIDHLAIEMRMWLWQTWKYGVQGILIWETTWWTSDDQFKEQRQDPWQDPMSYVGGGTGVWGNGDGRFFYPPRSAAGGKESLDAPVVSMRWEMLGDGIEDWEYFHILKERIAALEAAGKQSPALARAKALLTVPPAITTDMTHFTRDPQLLFSHRARLAQAIEALGG